MRRPRLEIIIEPGERRPVPFARERATALLYQLPTPRNGWENCDRCAQPLPDTDECRKTGKCPACSGTVRPPALAAGGAEEEGRG